MPWDPKPVQQPSAAASSLKDEQDEQMLSQSGEMSMSGQPQQEIKYEHVKQELKYDNAYGMSTYPGSAINQAARERASNLLQQQFGSQANASIQAAGLPQQPRPLSLPGQQRTQHPQPGGQRPGKQYPSQGSLGAAQHDGAPPPAASEWADVVTRTREAEADRPRVDGLLRAKLDGLASDMDSGVFSSASRAPKATKSAKRRSSPKPLPGMPPQRDGPDEEEDEDAINSALDDSDDELDQEQVEEDGVMGEMILCTWDKVNRVKNKVFLSRLLLYF